MKKHSRWTDIASTFGIWAIVSLFLVKLLLEQNVDILNLKADVWIAIAAVIIAMCALITTIWQGKITKQHNILSVKPILSIVREFDTNNEKVGVYIINNGIGPAILTESTISNLITNSSYSLSDVSYRDLFKPKVNFENHHFCTLGRNRSFLPNKKVWLVSKQLSAETENHQAEAAMLLSALGKLTIKLKYKSIYDESFECCLLSLQIISKP
jgi:uncharacterized membrane protein